MRLDGPEIINQLPAKMTPILERQGIMATANYADQPDERQQRVEFYSDRFVRLRAVKRGKEQQVEFRQTVEIEEVGRLGLDAVSIEFCNQATNALAKIDMK